jgi:hypothetical protein
MIRKVATAISLGIYCLFISGCLYRGDGIFNQIGTSNYKTRIQLGQVFVATGGIPSAVCGTVLLEDHITPLKYTKVLLKKSDAEAVISNEHTDHIGKFCMTGILSSDYYVIEVDSPQYIGNKVILVDPNKQGYHDIFARRK